MTDADFLDAIADAPDDDLLCFAYADWLEDRGDGDRAEFIRLRVELSYQQRKNAAKEKRARALLKAHRRPWLGDLLAAAPERDWRFPRGVLEKLWVTNRPVVHKRLTALARTPQVSHLCGLHLRNTRIDSAGIGILAASPYFFRLNSLGLTNNPIGDPGARILADTPQFARLTKLFLWADQIGNEGASALADSTYLTRLTALYLDYNQIGSVGASALAASPRLAQLRYFSLSSNNIDDIGAEALAASQYLAEVQVLNLRNNNIGPTGRRAFEALGRPRPPGLTGAAVVVKRQAED